MDRYNPRRDSPEDKCPPRSDAPQDPSRFIPTPAGCPVLIFRPSDPSPHKPGTLDFCGIAEYEYDA